MLEELIDALLYEGYALYPYTPGATDSATPTPLGIVYPPAYADSHPSTFDHVRMDAGLAPAPAATLQAEARFLQAARADGSERAIERRVELPATPLAKLAGDSVGTAFAFDGLTGTVSMRAESVRDGLTRVRICVHNTTPLVSAAAAGRGRALESSLMSTHVIASAPGSRFESCGEHPEWSSVNTFPVIATPEDDTMLGATIVLPDHPQIAPESRGSLFDGTEIEEALPRVHTLSQYERQAIADG